MAGPFEFVIHGQRELEAAFLALRREVLAGMRPALREAGQVVARDAQAKATENISHIGARWSRMRVGVTVKGVYIAPRSRRSGGSPRANLAGLLMNRAMLPAVEEKQDEVLSAFEVLVDESAARNGFF